MSEGIIFRRGFSFIGNVHAAALERRGAGSRQPLL